MRFASEPRCGHCREPFLDGADVLRFCCTCDRWMHDDCLDRHASVEPDGAGDWRHVPREAPRETTPR